jgi:hypothetical protein
MSQPAREFIGNVALGLGLFVGSYIVGYFNGAAVDSVC